MTTTYDARNGVVRLVVSDNGPGVPAADREKLFMPYYSTKGRGSGLGLAIVRRIVVEHGGGIEAAPRETVGDDLHRRAAGGLMSSILLVDDEAGRPRLPRRACSATRATTVDTVESGEACLDQVTHESYDVILLDVWLPGIDGLATLERLRERSVDAQVIMISGHASVEAAVRATKLGAFDFIEKPLSLEKTVLAVRNALRQRRLEVENRALRARVDRRLTIVGDSPVMRRLRDQIEMTAPSNGRVLIAGENGTGKELVARQIHALSHRRTGPFVEVNCAAIPEELIESELFGHAKGAFTGAVADRRGSFENATGGTLFLDEVGDMSLKTQAKVLRALQEQVIEPVGGQRSVRVDVRVIAATNKDLVDRDAERPVPRGSVFPPQRHPDVRAGAARPRRRRDPARGAFRRGVRQGVRTAAQAALARGDGAASRIPLAGQRARAAQRHRAPHDHGAGRTGRAGRSRVPRHRRGAGRGRQPVSRFNRCSTRATPGSAATSSARSPRSTATSRRTAEALGLERSNLYKKMRSLGISPGQREEG